MSLYFNQRMDEQKEDPLKDKIKFTFPWIHTEPPMPFDEDEEFSSCIVDTFRTSYLFSTEEWRMTFSTKSFEIEAVGTVDDDDVEKVWNGACYFSYKLYYDDAMRFLHYSSPSIRMMSHRYSDTFRSPKRYMTKIAEAVKAQSIRTMVIFVELQLPAKYFSRPYYMPTCDLVNKLCHQYPADIEKDFRFSFSQRSDFVIKCPDGSVSCMRIVLNISSEFFKTYFKTSMNPELVVYHSLDVTKLVMTYLHTECFEMPKAYDLDFAKRLLFALDFFQPKHECANIKNSIHLSLCQKFADECKNFDSILQWTSLATRQSWKHLEKMIATVIAEKYYYKWLQTFPPTARNVQNLLFFDIFGSESTDIFETVDEIFTDSLSTNVILE